eukprot:Phypoly_transcript_00118.p1 GENE.Phypoly_transcript_00118~~Phypoly_transcript_00118.p1  ORF type:complete len:1360 (+),score=201.42 Phypoly_transcript_00118:444-4523(+)
MENLQWADANALELLGEILEHCSTNLLLVCGYSASYEESMVQPFLDSQNGSASSSITHVSLVPLTITQLTADICLSLHPKNEADIQLLSHLISKKVKGNAYVANQVVKALYQTQALRFDWERHVWIFDKDAVDKVTFNGDFPTFFDRALDELHPYTQLVLKVGATVGFMFSASLLALFTNIFPHEIDTAIAVAVHNDYIQKCGDHMYRFANSRVHAAAGNRCHDRNLEIHLEIGTVMSSGVLDVTSDLFSAVYHLNKALPIIHDAQDRVRLRKLNLRAAQLGNYGIAFKFALDCVHNAMQLQAPDCWESDYEETAEIYNVCVKSEYISGNIEKALQLHGELKRHCRNTQDKLNSILVLIHLHIGALKYTLLPALGRECFALLGCDIKENLTIEDLNDVKKQIDAIFQKNPISELIDIPPMTDPLYILLLEVGWLMTNTYYVENMFFMYVHMNLVLFTLRLGWGPRSGMSATSVATIYSDVYDEHEKAYDFASMAAALTEKYTPNSIQQSMTACLGNAHVLALGNHHLRESIPHLTRAYNQLLRAGEKTFSRVSATYLYANRHFAGENLFTVFPDLMKAYKKMIDGGPSTRPTAIHLRGFIELSTGLMGPLAPQSEANIKFDKELGTTTFLVVWYRYYTGVLYYLLGDFEEALCSFQEGYNHMMLVTSFLLLSRYVFYHSMTLTALCGTANENKKQEYLRIVHENQQKQKKYWDMSPVNCSHLYRIVEANLSRIANNSIETTSNLYEVAVNEAREGGFVVEEAIANELYGDFLISRGMKWAGSMLIQHATKKFYSYGAAAKCKLLEEKYFPDEIKKSHESEEDNSLRPKVNVDFAFAKASQLLSQEIDVNKLVEKAMEIIAEHAGADHGILMIRDIESSVKNDVYEQLMVKAIWQVFPEKHPKPSESAQERKAGHVAIHPTMVPLNGSIVPESLVSFVAHSRRLVVLNDIPGSDFAYDEYFAKNQPKSALCLPIQQMGTLKGVLFLESMTSNKIFSAQRLKVIDFLCSQIGISLENALLYSKVTSSEAQYQILADTIPQYVFAAHPDGDVYFANKRLAEYLGSEVASSPWTAFIHPDHLNETKKVWSHAVATGEEYQIEYLLRRGDGTFKWFLARAAPVRNHLNNAIIKWFGTLTDIDDKKKEVAEAAMRAQIEASEKKYRLLAEAIPIMVWSANEDGIADYANQKWVDYMGFNVTKVPFSWGPDSIYFEDWLIIKDKWMRALRDKTSFEAEYRVKRGRDGVFRWHLVRALPMHEQHSSGSVRWFGTCTDVHTQKMAEIELVIAREAAERTAQNQASFLANMSHEIRTPLNGILGMIDILIESALTLEQRDYANTIQRSGDSLLNIVNDILDFSKSKLGK